MQINSQRQKKHKGARKIRKWNGIEQSKSQLANGVSPYLHSFLLKLFCSFIFELKLNYSKKCKKTGNSVEFTERQLKRSKAGKIE